jgi:hypothetical protein
MASAHPRSHLWRLPRIAAFLVLVPLPALAGCGGPAKCNAGDTACLRILFVGNSYTFANDLPGTLTALAQSGSHKLETDSLASGGATLADHVADAATAARLDAEKWNFVVLQEQSQIPSVQASRQYTMYPAARTLAGEIRQRQETPLFFMIWAHRDGWPEDGMPDYGSMQSAIQSGYMAIAGELHAGVAPVGHSWSTVRQQSPGIGLWQDDGSHPSIAGTYLAACVFYAAIFRTSPAGLGYTDGLPSGTAQTLQNAAGVDVLSNAGQWGLQ